MHKPCIFCGSLPEIRRGHSADYYDIYLECPKCRIRTSSGDSWSFRGGLTAAEDEWNTLKLDLNPFDKNRLFKFKHKNPIIIFNHKYSYKSNYDRDNALWKYLEKVGTPNFYRYDLGKIWYTYIVYSGDTTTSTFNFNKFALWLSAMPKTAITMWRS